MSQSVLRLGLVTVLCCAAAAGMAATTPTSNPIPDLNTEPGPLDLAGPPATIPAARRPAPPARSGNPLWGVPLSVLTATRDRPLFSPARRPPAPAVLNAPVTAVRVPPPPQEHPDLILVGTVAEASITRGTEGIAVFLDDATHATVRLHTGEGHMGWILQAVGSRAAVLQKGGRTETLALPQPATAGAPQGPSPAAAMIPPPPPPPPVQTNPVVGAANGCSPTVGC